VIVVDDDDFNDDDLLMMMNSYMQSNDVIDDEHMYKSDDVNDDDLLGKHIHYWAICACIHKLWSRIFISSDDDYDILYPVTMIRIFCIQWRRL